MLRPTYKNDLEEHFLVNLHELLVPLIDIGSLLANIVVILISSGRVGSVIGAPFNDFLQDSFVDLLLGSVPKVRVEVRGN